MGNCPEIVPRLVDKSVVGLRWIYKVKQAADGSVEKYKEIFVAQGFSQIEGIDYEETFAPIALYSSIRTILALSMQMAHSSIRNGRRRTMEADRLRLDAAQNVGAPTS